MGFEKGLRTYVVVWAKFWRIVGSLIIFGAIVGLWLPLYLFFETKGFLKVAVRTEARVVQLEKRNDCYFPVLSFVDESGDEHRIPSSYGSYPPRYEVGDSVQILYNPENPKKVEIDAFFVLWFGPIIGFAITTVAIMMGLLFFFVAPLISARLHAAILPKDQRSNR